MEVQALGASRSPTAIGYGAKPGRSIALLSHVSTIIVPKVKARSWSQIEHGGVLSSGIHLSQKGQPAIIKSMATCNLHPAKPSPPHPTLKPPAWSVSLIPAKACGCGERMITLSPRHPTSPPSHFTLALISDWDKETLIHQYQRLRRTCNKAPAAIGRRSLLLSLQLTCLTYLPTYPPTGTYHSYHRVPEPASPALASRNNSRATANSSADRLCSPNRSPLCWIGPRPKSGVPQPTHLETRAGPGAETDSI